MESHLKLVDSYLLSIIAIFENLKEQNVYFPSKAPHLLRKKMIYKIVYRVFVHQLWDSTSGGVFPLKS